MRKILDPQVQLVLMVVPAQKSDRYAAIKKLCCIESPVPSQESAHHMFARISKLRVCFHEIFFLVSFKGQIHSEWIYEINFLGSYFGKLISCIHCGLIHGGLYRRRENSLPIFSFQKLKGILTLYSRTILKASKN